MFSENTILELILAIQAETSRQDVNISELNKNINQLTTELSRLTEKQLKTLPQRLTKQQVETLKQALTVADSTLRSNREKGLTEPKGGRIVANVDKSLSEFSRLMAAVEARLEDIKQSALSAEKELTRNKQEYKKTRRESVLKTLGLGNLPIKVDVAYKNRLEKAISQEAIQLMSKVMGTLPTSHKVSLVSPVSKQGREGGYHSIYEQGPYGNFMHMMDVGRRAADLTSTREFQSIKNIDKGLEALQLAAGLHDVFKYYNEGGTLKYDPSHGYKIAEHLQENFIDELTEYYGEDLAQQIIDAVKMHHFSQTTEAGKRAIAAAKAKAREQGKEEGLFWEDVPISQLGTIDRFIRQKELIKAGKKDVPMPYAGEDYLSFGQEWYDILSKASLEELRDIKKRFESDFVQALKNADVAAAKDTRSLLDPDEIISVLEGASLIDAEVVSKYHDLTKTQQEILTEFLAKELAGVRGEANLDQVNKILSKMGVIIPALVNGFTGPLGDLSRQVDEANEKASKSPVSPAQLKAAEKQINDALLLLAESQASVLEESLSAMVPFLQTLGYNTDIYRDPKDVFEAFLANQGDLLKLYKTAFDRTGYDSSKADIKTLAKFTSDKTLAAGSSIIAGVRERFENLVTTLESSADALKLMMKEGDPWGGVDADLMRGIATNPKLFDPVIQTLLARKDEASREQAKKIQEMRDQYIKLYENLKTSIATPQGIVDLNELFSRIALDSKISRFSTTASAYKQKRIDQANMQPSSGAPVPDSPNVRKMMLAKAVKELEANFKKLEGFETALDDVPTTWREDVQAFLDHFDEFGVNFKGRLEAYTKMVDALLAEMNARPIPALADLQKETTAVQRLSQAEAISSRLAAVSEDFEPKNLSINLRQIREFLNAIIESGGTFQQLRDGVDVTEQLLELTNALTKAYYDQAKAMGKLIEAPLDPDQAAAERYRQQTKLARLMDSYSQLPDNLKSPKLAANLNALQEALHNTGKASESLFDRVSALLDLLHDKAKRAMPKPSIEENFAEQMAVKRRLAMATSMLQEFDKFEKLDPGFKSVLTPEELQQLRNSVELLGSVAEKSGKYNLELVNLSKEMETIAKVLQSERYIRRENVNASKEEQRVLEAARKARLKAIKEEEKLASKRAERSFSSMGGGRGSGRGGLQSLPITMGGGGQAGWVARQMMWQVAGPIIQSTSIYSMIRQATEAVKQQELAVINLRRVYNGLDDDIQILSNSITDLAVDFGSVVDQVGKIEELWAKTGKSTAEEIKFLSEASLLALNTSDIESAEESVKYLNSALQQMNLGWYDAIDLLDSWNKVADKFPADTKDLAEGYARAGSYARALKLDIHDLNAIISVLVEKTGRSGAEVSTALRMMFSNIYRLKSLETIRSFGVDPYMDGLTTQYRPFMDLMDDLSAKFKEMQSSEKDGSTSVNKILLASALGQARQRNFAIALLDSWERVKEIIEESEDSSGYSMKKMEKTTESLAFKGRQLRAAFQEAAVTLGESGLIDILKKLTGAGTKILTVFSDLPPGIKESVSWFLMLNGVLGTLNKILHSTSGVGLSLQLANRFGLLEDGKIAQMLIGHGIDKVAGNKALRSFTDDPSFRDQVRSALQPRERSELSELLSQERVLTEQLAQAKLDLANQEKIYCDLLLESMPVKKASGDVVKNITKLKKSSMSATIAKTSVEQLATTVTKAKSGADVISAQVTKGKTAATVADTAAELANIAVKKKQIAATMAAKAAQKLASIGTTLAISALVGLVSWVLTYNKAQEERRKKALEEYRDLDSKNKRLKEVVKTQKELAETEARLRKEAQESGIVSSRLKEVQEDLNRSYQELAELLPEAGVQVDEHGNRIAKATEHTEEAIEQNDILLAQMRELQRLEAERRLPQLEAKRETVQSNLDRYMPLQEQILAAARGKTLEQKQKEKISFELIPGDPNSMQTMSIAKAIEWITTKIVDQSKELQSLNEEIAKNKQLIEDAYKSDFAAANPDFVAKTEELRQQGESIIAGFEAIAGDAKENVQEHFSGISDTVETVIQGLESGKKSTEKYKAAYRELIELLQADVGTELRKDPNFLKLPEHEQQKQIIANAEARAKDVAGLQAWYDAMVQEAIDQEFLRLQEQQNLEATYVENVESWLAHIAQTITTKSIEAENVGITPDQRGKILADIAFLQETMAILRSLLTGVQRASSKAEIEVKATPIYVPRTPTYSVPRSSGSSAKKDPYEKLNKRLAKTDHNLRMIRGDLDILEETWRNHTDSLFYVEAKTKLLNKEQSALNSAIKETEKELKTLRKNKSKHADKIQDLESRLQDLNRQYLANVNSLYELKLAMRELAREEFDKKIQAIDRSLEDLDLTLRILSAGLKQGADSFQQLEIEGQKYSQQATLINTKIRETNRYLSELRAELRDAEKALSRAKPGTQAYSNAANDVKTLQEAIENLEDSLRNLNGELLDIQESLEDYISSLLTTGYEKQLENQIKAIDDLIEKEQKRHDEWVKNRQEEIELLRKGWEEDDFEQEMARLRQEEDNLWAQYYRIQYDNTAWAEKERARLQQEIRDKQREIEEKEEARRREKQIEAIEKEIEAETEAHEQWLEEQDEKKEKIQEEMDEILEYIEATTAGIVTAWRETGFNIITLLESLVPEIGDIAEKAAQAWTKGFNYGMDQYSKEGGIEHTIPGALPPEPKPEPPKEESPPKQPTTPKKTSTTYTVKSGDSLYKIAQKYPKNTINDIYQANKSLIDSENRRRGVAVSKKWVYPGQKLTIPKAKKGFLVDRDGLIFAHENEVVLPAKYKYTMDMLSDLVKMPKKMSSSQILQVTTNNTEVSVEEAVHIENAYFRDELDLRTIEIRAAKQLKKSLQKKGVRLE